MKNTKQQGLGDLDHNYIVSFYNKLLTTDL